MTYSELTREIKALPRSKRLDLMEVIIETLSEEEQPPVRAVSSLQRLSGIAKPDGPAPTDEEIEQIRAQYLIEKYL
jgi:hypothetical protein